MVFSTLRKISVFLCFLAVSGFMVFWLEGVFLCFLADLGLVVSIFALKSA